MNKEEFIRLNALERMEYLNKKLSEDKNLSLSKICKDIIKIDEKTNRNYLKNHNIFFDKNKRQYYISNTNVTPSIEIVEEYKKDTNVTLINNIDLEIQQNIIDIMKDAEILKQMIEQYKSNTTVLHQKLIIDLPPAPTKHTTVRVNEKVLEAFSEFADKNKQYSKIDLISQALKEFIEKYN